MNNEQNKMSNEPNKPIEAEELTEKELEGVVGGRAEAAASIRYPLDEKGLNVAFPKKTDGRAGL